MGCMGLGISRRLGVSKDSGESFKVLSGRVLLVDFERDLWFDAHASERDRSETEFLLS
jgi:hypothetical protein